MSIRCLKRHEFIVLLVAAALSLAATGCSSTGKPKAGAPVLPHRLAIELKADYTDGRHSLITLSEQGELAFVGGREAMTRMTPDPVGFITVEQQEKLWDIVSRHDLIHADSHTFGKGDRVTYKARIKAAGLGSNSFRAIDEEVGGMKELQDALMDMQATLNYAKNLPPK